MNRIVCFNLDIYSKKAIFEMVSVFNDIDGIDIERKETEEEIRLLFKAEKRVEEKDFEKAISEFSNHVLGLTKEEKVD